MFVPATSTWLLSPKAGWVEGRMPRAGGPVLGGVDGPAGAATYRPSAHTSHAGSL